MNLYKYYLSSLFFSLLLILLAVRPSLALEPGTILYRTSSEGKMYGYSSKELIKEQYGVMTNIYSGHAAVYIGKEDGVDYIVEALGSGIVKTPAQYFINESNGENLVAAKIPRDSTPWQRARAVALAKYLAGADLAYDFDFSSQKGPWSGDWTCVGLSEKIYESSNAANPERLGALEYDPSYYAVDITPDGYDADSLYNDKGDCFSARREFSAIARRVATILPPPEIIGYNAGKEYAGKRYLFLPYTQALQKSLVSVPVDIDLSSTFNDKAVRGKVNNLGVILRWGLVDNPVSSVKQAAKSVTKAVKYLFSGQEENTALLWDDQEKNADIIEEENSALSKLPSFSTPPASEFLADKNVSVSDNYSKKEETVLKDQSPLVEEDEIATEENNSFDSREEPASADIFSAARPLLSSSVESSAAESTPLTPLAATTKKTSQSNVALWSPLATKIPPATSTSSTTTNNNATLDNNEVAEAAPLTLLISRVYSEGNDDWLEIWNYGEEDIDLVARKVRLEKSKTAVDPGIILRFDNIADRSFVSGSIIRAGEGYRVVRDDAAEELRVAASALALRPDFTLMDNAYTIYLASAAVSSPDDEDIIDTIGYGEAKYFEGAAPAPALEAGYLLRRKADANTQLVDILSGGSKENWPPVYDNDNNKNDWLLWPLGGVVPTADNEADDNNDNNQDNTDNNQNNNDNNDNSDDSGDSTSTPFTLSPGVNSAGLLKLWSFEECRGSTTAEMISHNNNLSLSQGTKWTIGRWGCGWRLPYQADGLITANLQPLLSGENFTLAFQFKDSGEYGHVYFNFYNQSENIAMKFDIFSNMMQFQGFPGLDGRYDCPGFMDNKWHQGSLVWNAIGGYWGVYIDGVEIFHQAFSGLAPGFDRVDFGAVAGIINIDDLALWNRALSLEELQSLASTAKPFNPQVLRENPASLLLKHAWNFDEASGTIAHDSVGALNWQLPEGALVYNGLSGKGLAFPPIGSSYPLSLPALKTNNFSASWWWQNNAALPYSGRLHIDFNQGTERLAGFIVDNSRQRLWANGEDEYLADGHEVLPEDNLWHHLALVYDDYRYLWQFFVDGVLKLESQRLPLLRGASIDNISLSSSVWDYKLDNFKLWQGSLDAAKVLSEYQAEKPE